MTIKKYIVLVLLLSMSILTYSQKFWGEDHYRILTAETTIGEMENVIAGSSRRKLMNSEAIVITLKQEWDNNIKHIRIKSLPSKDYVDFLTIPVGKVENFKYYFNGREIHVGDIIEFPGNSKKIEIKILGTYVGYEMLNFFRFNNIYTEWLGGIKLEYDVPFYKEKNRKIDISWLYYETHVIPRVKVNVSGKMDFGQVVAGNSARASVNVDVYYNKKNSTYDIPDSIDIKNSNGDSLKVKLSSSNYYNNNFWDSYSRIKIDGNVKTLKSTPTGKYKGSFYVKFRFK